MKRSTRILGSLFTLVLLVVSLLGAAPVEALRTVAATYNVTLARRFRSRDLARGDHIGKRQYQHRHRDGYHKIHCQWDDNPCLASFPYITGNLVIDGTGFKVVLNGNNTRRVLHIISGIVVINNLTIHEWC